MLRIKTVSKDVTDVKNEPANRIDPLTGYPYSIQSDITLPEFKKEKETEMERLGFAEGGNFIRDRIGAVMYPVYKKGAELLGFDEEMRDAVFEDTQSYIDTFEEQGKLKFSSPETSNERRTDIDEIVRHALLSYRVGDTKLKRAALQIKDATQAGMYYGTEPAIDIQTRESLGPKSGYGFRNERGDIKNNRVGFMLRDKYGDDEQAAMEELMGMIERNDDSLHYLMKSNLKRKSLSNNFET